MLIVIFLGVLLAGIVIGLPIAYVPVLVGVALMFQIDFFNAQIVSQNMILGIDNFLLLAIPFFILAGELMNKGASRSGSSTSRCRSSGIARGASVMSASSPR